MMAFLLDGLSEDLNLVESKPYVENPDSNDRPDGELANMWWANHLRRENSVVQALFTGQFKSDMVCGCGQYASSRFEPFTFPTLPVPEQTERRISIFVMGSDAAHAVEISLRTHKDRDLSDIRDKLLAMDLPDVPASSDFLVTEVSSSLVTSLCTLERKIATIKDTDNIFFFRLPRPVGPATAIVSAVAPAAAPNATAANQLTNKDVAMAKMMESMLSKLGTTGAPGTAGAAKPIKRGSHTQSIQSLLRTDINGVVFVSSCLLPPVTC